MADDIYRKLQQHLDRGPVGFPATESGVEIRILEAIFTPEEAELVLELSAFPEPAKVVHRRVKERMSLDELAATLERMALEGKILGVSMKGEDRYAKRVFVIGFFESQVHRLTPQLVRDSDAYFEEAFGGAFHTGKTTQLRTVPVNRSIPTARSVSSFENIRAYLEASAGPFAAMDCICRHGKDLLGDPCRQTKLRENCLTVGVAAEYVVKQGLGRLVSKEEILDLVSAADRDGLVLQPENTQNPIFICCCCGCCCGVLLSAKRMSEPARFFTANFYAEADAGLCQACGACEVRCQMEAIGTNDGIAYVDRSRCIGCGLCATTCPSGAMEMKLKEDVTTPAESSAGLYLRLLKDRYGATGVARLAALNLVGRKV